MDDDIFESMPDDDEQAFVYLEKIYRDEVESQITSQSSGESDSYFRNKYISNVIAAARSLNIDGVKDYALPRTSENNYDFYNDFTFFVSNIITQIRINSAKRKKKFSVHLTNAEKEKIRHYVDQIKSVLDNSGLEAPKKEAIFARLAVLLAELDKDRTRFEVFTDGIRALSRLSGDVERDGAEPWWKWVKLIFGVIDEAKEKEPQTSLPAPEERKRIEPPRKQLPGPEQNSGDDIPF